MRISRTTLVLLSLFLFVFAVGLAVAQEAPKPTPEHEALAVWTGHWAGSGELKPGPFGPGGPMSWTEHCDWFEGARFNVVCKSEGTGPMGPSKGLAIVGYDAGKKVYTHYGVDSTGWSGYSEGTRSGETWTFTADETIEGKTYPSRFTMTMKSPSEIAFSWAISEDGKSWTTMMDGVSKKK